MNILKLLTDGKQNYHSENIIIVKLHALNCFCLHGQILGISKQQS